MFEVSLNNTKCSLSLCRLAQARHTLTILMCALSLYLIHASSWLSSSYSMAGNVFKLPDHCILVSLLLHSDLEQPMSCQGRWYEWLYSWSKGHHGACFAVLGPSPLP